MDSCCSADRTLGGVGTVLPGDEGLDDVVRVGVVDLTGVPVLDGSWLAIGVISVPMSLIDTDLAVEGGGINVVEPYIDMDESWQLKLTSTMKIKQSQ